jgi:hypothetical protein
MAGGKPPAIRISPLHASMMMAPLVMTVSMAVIMTMPHQPSPVHFYR